LPGRLEKELLVHKWKIIMAASGVLFLFVVFGNLLPIAGELQALKKEISVNRTRLNEIKDGEFILKKIEGQKKALSRKMNDLAEARAAGSASGVLAVMTRRARESRVDILKLEPGEPVKTEAGFQLSVKMSARGQYHGLCRYLYDLETRDPVVRIEQWSFKNEKMGRDGISADLQLVAYYPEKLP
jgi:hypothetical protein